LSGFLVPHGLTVREISVQAVERAAAIAPTARCRSGSPATKRAKMGKAGNWR
jgi:hypothetical protein